MVAHNLLLLLENVVETLLTRAREVHEILHFRPSQLTDHFCGRTVTKSERNSTMTRGNQSTALGGYKQGS